MSFAWFRDAILYPLRRLYFDGPDVHGYGWWGGRAATDVCAQLTNVDAAFWARNPDDCRALLERKFVAFYLGAAAIAVAVGTYLVLQFFGSWLWYHLCVVRPMRQMFERVCTASSSITIRDEFDDPNDFFDDDDVFEKESDDGRLDLRR